MSAPTIDMRALPEWTRHAVLLYGPRKGGTTLVQNLLDGSDDLLVFPIEVKLKLLLRDLFSGGENALATYRSHSRLRGLRPPHFDAGRYEELVEATLGDAPGSLADLLRADAAAVHACIETRPPAPRLWAMKEVGGDTHRIVRLFRHLFLDGRIVLILREPRSVTASVLRERKRKGVRIGLRKLLYEIVDPIRVLQAQAELAPDPTVHAVVYEYVAGGRTAEEMRLVCEYLGIEYREIFERPTLFGEGVVTRTSSVETKSVFVNTRDWRDEMNLVERCLTRAVHSLAALYYRLRRGRYHTYAEVREAVEQGRKRAA